MQGGHSNCQNVAFSIDFRENNAEIYVYLGLERREENTKKLCQRLHIKCFSQAYNKLYG